MSLAFDAGTMGRVVTALGAVDPGGPPMMEDETSLSLFLVVIMVLSAVAAVVLPFGLRRLTLKASVPALAVVGPVLGLMGAGIGTATMRLSGHEISYSLVVSGCAGVVAIVVGLRLARPVARELDRVAVTVQAVAGGDRTARTGVERPDEIGQLAGAVDELARSLARVESEREMAEAERRFVVSALSHDLRSPLASLLASIDALSDGIGDPADHLRAMRASVVALDVLVGDLFLLARADAGRLALVREPVDLAELIDEAVEAVQALGATHRVTVKAGSNRSLPVDGDHQSLARVLRNLLDNAIRHSPSGAVVTVTGSALDGRARVEVLDQGPGFPADFTVRAFDRFSQLDDARRRPGSAGLGLAIVQTLVQAHGGTVAIQPGSGGHVCLELPLGSGADRRRPGAVGGAIAQSPIPDTSSLVGPDHGHDDTCRGADGSLLSS